MIMVVRICISELNKLNGLRECIICILRKVVEQMTHYNESAISQFMVFTIFGHFVGETKQQQEIESIIIINVGHLLHYHWFRKRLVFDIVDFNSL